MAVIMVARRTSNAWSFLLSFITLLNFGCAQTKSGLQSLRTHEGIEILDGDSKVLFYRIKPTSLDGEFERAHYIHPLYTLEGKEITEDFPEDHPYHHGIYTAWHQILFNEKPIADAWTSENISWKVTDATASKKDKAVVLNSEVLWISSVGAQSPEPIVRETLELIVHQSNDQFRIIDFNFSLVALKDPIQIGGSEDEKGYGGFCVRIKLPQDIRFVAQDREVKAQTLSIDAGPWMNFRGSFNGEAMPESGLAVFSHPSNPGHPQPWILRKEKSMQNPAFPGREPVVLPKDGLHFQYRMVVHKGSLAVTDIERLYGEYAGL